MVCVKYILPSSVNSNPLSWKWLKDGWMGVKVDFETRRKKQQDLMIRMVERKVRERAQQLYEERGQTEGQALGDWVQAEEEVLGGSIVAPLYRRVRTARSQEEQLSGQDASDDDSDLVGDEAAVFQESV